MNKEYLFKNKLLRETNLKTPSEFLDGDPNFKIEKTKELEEINKELCDNGVSENEYQEWKTQYINFELEQCKQETWITLGYTFPNLGHYEVTLPEYELEDFEEYLISEGAFEPFDIKMASDEEIIRAISLNADSTYEERRDSHFDEVLCIDEDKEKLFKETLQCETMLKYPNPLIDNDLEQKETYNKTYEKNNNTLKERKLLSEYLEWARCFCEALYEEYNHKQWIIVEYTDNRDANSIKTYKVPMLEEQIESFNKQIEELLGFVISNEPTSATKEEVITYFKLHALDL